ncbi:MAG: hypothetical protein CMJ76_03320 [Planctomycetaceae bacterium]|nr:hypothetical protein [Planctomycetaceae bacterium]|tara:strand:- start:1632 stop:2048 length:417 start_codon:yes stop_codon:yes gene_type:complete
MAKLTAVFGFLLIGNGLYGYLAGDSASVTALIPAFVGIALLLCAIGSIAKPALNMHLMHVAALLGLLGCLAALGRLIPSFSDEEAKGLVQVNLGLMAVLCGGYVYSCIRSFKEAGRRRREAAAMESSTADVPATVEEE